MNMSEKMLAICRKFVSFIFLNTKALFMRLYENIFAYVRHELHKDSKKITTFFYD